ncbi:hypothetical protein ACM43_14680 [Bradyrhizobium sp. CCBAU 45321]|nr:hypothetical protein [Bradyrhizobium sp. CCBAU 45321]
MWFGGLADTLVRLGWTADALPHPDLIEQTLALFKEPSVVELRIRMLEVLLCRPRPLRLESTRT